ncbi:hypothetical protein K443DRAFT_120783 [Laccaria amethystina LaAM-08-1]|uniref:Uncharacterized protein n=1 Tax=Laccaria amethystina LaAM-08-1 TaxID=1095629 RepID=A0A0C9XIC7_9AGAR|nr:hypothetical protein K443DRAFT_120783 [Laccaria amethystina LaAM-08-1]
MACRSETEMSLKSDRAKFVGCRVGAPRIRGCARECCYYSDSEIQSKERWDYLKSYTGSQDPLLPTRTSLASIPRSSKKPHVPEPIPPKLSMLEGNKYTASDSESRPGWWYSSTPANGFKETDPVACWTPLGNSRCPRCAADGTPVGGKFQVPKQDDEKEWRGVEALLGHGETFTCCISREEEEGIMQGAKLEMKRVEGRESWQIEKKRRIEALRYMGKG